ncbi:MAG: hypothetical protein ACQEP5_01040 [Actinomycetota bacterium]
MEKKLDYDQLLYLIEEAEALETKIIEMLKASENMPETRRGKYFDKIKELEAKISNIKIFLESYLKQD